MKQLVELAASTKNLIGEIASLAWEIVEGIWDQHSPAEWEKLIILMKYDLQLSKVFAKIHDSLLQSIQNKNYFSESLTHYFDGLNNCREIDISSEDPIQIAAFKKILKALAMTRDAFSELESVKVYPDESKDSFLARLKNIWNTFLHGKETLATATPNVSVLYEALQLINDSSVDIQIILEPHAAELWHVINFVYHTISSIEPRSLGENTGRILGGVISSMPEQASSSSRDKLYNLSQTFHELPEFLKLLNQNLSDAFDIDTLIKPKGNTSAQKKIRKKTEELAPKLERLLKSSSWIKTMPAALKVIKPVLRESSDIIEQMLKLTHNGYEKAINAIEKLRDETLPELVNKIEMLEEGLCLKPGTIVKPLLEQLQSLHETVSNQVDNIAYVAGITDRSHSHLDKSWYGKLAHKWAGAKPNRPVSPLITKDTQNLFSPRFIEKLTKLQLHRLEESELKQDSSIIDNFELFLNKPLKYANDPEYRNELKKLYKPIQSNLAEKYPELDKNIVSILNNYDQNKNKISSVQECLRQETSKIKELILQTQSQIKLQSELIKASMQSTNEIIQTFKPVENKLNPTAEYFKEPDHARDANEVETIVSQRHTLLSIKTAKQSLDSFFEELVRLNFMADKVNPSPEVRHKLRCDFEKFQPFLLNLERQTNKIMCETLNTENKKLPEQHVLSDMQQRLEDYLVALDEKYSEQLEQTRNNWQTRQKQSLERSSLTPQHENLRKPTLFAQIREFQLSEKIQNLIDGSLKDWMEKNLSPAVFSNIKFDLPFKKLHESSPQVGIYQRLLNSLHHIQHTAESLEKLDSRNPSRFLGRLMFVIDAFKDIVLEISDAQAYLRELTYKHGIEFIHSYNNYVEQLQGIFTPILPFLDQYAPFFRKAIFTIPTFAENQPSLSETMLDKWKKQQAIVAEVRSQKPASNGASSSGIHLAEREEILREPVENNLQPEASNPLEGGNSNSAMQEFVTWLHEIHAEILQIQDPSAEIDSDEAIKAKTNSLIAILNGLSIGPNSIKKIVEFVNELHALIRKDLREIRTLCTEKLSEIRSSVISKSLISRDNMEVWLGLKKGLLTDTIQSTFFRFFDELIRALYPNDPQAVIVLLNETKPVDDRLANAERQIEEIKTDDKAAKLKNLISGDGDLLEALKNLNDFEAIEETKEGFLNIYESLLPYLSLIDSKFDQVSYLRTLVKPVDFEKSRDEIIGLRSEFEKLHETIESTQKEEIELWQEKIEHLNNAALELLDQRRQEQLDDHINAVIAKQSDLKAKVFEKDSMLVSYARGVKGFVSKYIVPNIEKKISEIDIDGKDPIADQIDTIQSMEDIIEHQLSETFTRLKEQLAPAYKTYQSINDIKRYVEQSWPSSERAEISSLLNKFTNNFAPGEFRPNCFCFGQLNTRLDDMERDALSIQKHYTICQATRLIADMQKHTNPNLQDTANLLNNWQSILEDKSLSVEQRFDVIKNAVENKDNQKILHKNCDNWFVKMIKALLSLFGWKSGNIKREESLTNHFQTKATFFARPIERQERLVLPEPEQVATM